MFWAIGSLLLVLRLARFSACLKARMSGSVKISLRIGSSSSMGCNCLRIFWIGSREAWHVITNGVCFVGIFFCTAVILHVVSR